MAEIVNLKDRGQQVLTSVELYDESQLGAGRPMLNGVYASLSEVKEAITKVLEKSPIEPEGEATSPLSVNRFNSNNAWGKRTYYPQDLYPNKSRWIIHFLLKFNLADDFCYVDLGLNWAPFILANGKLNPKYPLGDYTEKQIFKLEDLKILRVCFCTVDDAVELVKSFGLTDPKALEIVDASVEVTPEQLEALKADGDVATIKNNGEDVILTLDGDILTINQSE